MTDSSKKTRQQMKAENIAFRTWLAREVEQMAARMGLSEGQLMYGMIDAASYVAFKHVDFTVPGKIDELYDLLMTFSTSLYGKGRDSSHAIVARIESRLNKKITEVDPVEILAVMIKMGEEATKKETI